MEKLEESKSALRRSEKGKRQSQILFNDKSCPWHPGLISFLLAKYFTVQCGVIKCGDEEWNNSQSKHGSSIPWRPQS